MSVEKNTRKGTLSSVLINKYYLGDQIKNNEMGRACSTYGEMRSVCRVLVRSPEG
jgi:hypothetical protein